MDFRVGQKVMLIDKSGMNALVGSIAVIERISKEFLHVTWTTPQSQANGAYYPFHFKSVVEKNQQLLFSFMGEEYGS